MADVASSIVDTPQEADVRAVAEAHGKTAEEFEQEVMALLRAWCGRHKGTVSRCLVSVCDGQVHVAIGGKNDAYDFALGERIAKLSLVFFRRGWERLNILQLPGDPQDDELKRFSTFAMREGMQND